jgi:hypothetical protein
MNGNTVNTQRIATIIVRLMSDKASTLVDWNGIWEVLSKRPANACPYYNLFYSVFGLVRRPEGELQLIPKPEFYFSGVGINETSGYS